MHAHETHTQSPASLPLVFTRMYLIPAHLYFACTLIYMLIYTSACEELAVSKLSWTLPIAHAFKPRKPE